MAYKRKGYTAIQKRVSKLYTGLSTGTCQVPVRQAIPSGVKRKGANRVLSPYIRLCVNPDVGRGRIHLSYMMGGCRFTGAGGPIYRKGYWVNSVSTGVRYWVSPAWVAQKGKGRPNSPEPGAKVDD
jgi:hypothetical protein